MRLILYKTGHDRIPGTNGHKIAKEIKGEACSLEPEETAEDEAPLSPCLDLIDKWDADDPDIGDLTVRAFAIRYGKPMSRAGRQPEQRTLYRQLSDAPGGIRRWRDIKPLLVFIHENEDRIIAAEKATEEIADITSSLTADVVATGDQKRLDGWLSDIEDMRSRIRRAAPQWL